MKATMITVSHFSKEIEPLLCPAFPRLFSQIVLRIPLIKWSDGALCVYRVITLPDELVD